jgi:GR25 family glycosyltransferase involved in LPS biosynthesis
MMMMMTITDLPVYVINLDRRPDRWQQIQHVLLDNGFNHIRRVAAVDGKTLNTATLDHIVSPDARKTLKRPRVRHEELGSVGAVGCYLSHVNVWQWIAQSGQPGIVVEDDCMLTSALKQYSVFKHPEIMCKPYDVVLLGYLVLRSSDTQSSAQDVIVPCKSMFFGTHFYYITPTGAQKLLKNALPITMQVDSYMGTEMLNNRVNTGVHFPNLSWQRANDTDIQTPCIGCDVSRKEQLQIRILLFLTFFVVIIFSVWTVFAKKNVLLQR